MWGQRSRRVRGREQIEAMWRSFFVAVGICLVILGVESLLLDRVILNVAEKSNQAPGYSMRH